MREVPLKEYFQNGEEIKNIYGLHSKVSTGLFGFTGWCILRRSSGESSDTKFLMFVMDTFPATGVQQLRIVNIDCYAGYESREGVGRAWMQNREIPLRHQRTKTDSLHKKHIGRGKYY